MEQPTATTPTSTTPTPTPTPFSPRFGVKYKVKVVRVLDGDTIDVILPGGSKEIVRMLCVDTPEKTAEDNKPYEYDNITDLECLAKYGLEAKEFTEKHLLGKEVYIEFDETAGLRGYYGRLLAYVYVDSMDFTAELVKKGYARVYEEGKCKKKAEYLSYQQQAMQSRLGLWSCMPTINTTGTMCDPSYPDVCIPPPPPDLDCDDIPYRKFRVLPPDPHNFDADNDGIRCEE
ncbi:thermonuclease family protein [Archaeoglobus profundus]|uniref:TNase-like domain-containing protein n=1 Tax=Archaeoglobus profundus pleomorphic provirus 1 TaxID=3115749 RepID=A0AAT9J7P8_9VIRU|nr:thermonuclease family protein [Archaeoglobus profundus]